MSAPKIELIHYPWDDDVKTRQKLADPQAGAHHYFRRVKEGVQQLFSKHFDYENTPKVFVFGSPHLDNYAKTNNGIGLIDFDRSYVGPYAWDLFVVLFSLSLRQQQGLDSYLKRSVVEALLSGYLQGYQQPENNYAVYEPLAKKKAKPWQLSAETYLDANKKWAKKLTQHPLPTDDPVLQSLVKQFIKHCAVYDLPRQINHFRGFEIFEAGRAMGSLGRAHNIIVLKHPKTKQSRILDIKQTKNYLTSTYQYNQHYQNPFIHEGIRMIAASDLHAPSVTGIESYATVNDIQYWGRELPTTNLKIKNNLDQEQQREYAFAVGTQIGRSHALSIKKRHRKALLKHLDQHYSTINQAAKTIQKQLLIAWKYYNEIQTTS